MTDIYDEFEKAGLFKPLPTVQAGGPGAISGQIPGTSPRDIYDEFEKAGLFEPLDVSAGPLPKLYSPQFTEPEVSKYPSGWKDSDEQDFKEWYKGWSTETGINPNPDDPRQKYDYRSAYKAGAFPEPGEDGVYHWPSQFKHPDHPNRYVNGVDTITGEADPELLGTVGTIADTISRSVSGLGRGAVAGVVTGLPQMGAQITEFLAHQFARLAPETGAALEKSAKEVADFFEEKKNEWFRKEDETALEKMFFSAGEMLGPSIIPGGIARTGLGLVFGIGKRLTAAKTAARALLKEGKVGEAAKLMSQAKLEADALAKKATNLASATAATFFGLSQAGDTMERGFAEAERLESEGRFDEAKKVRDMANGLAPLGTGIIEGIGEYLGTKYLAKFFRLDEVEAAKRGFRNLVKDFLKTLAVEETTEIGQAAGQAAIEAGVGIVPKKSQSELLKLFGNEAEINTILASALDVLGPTGIMTAVTGGFGVAVDAMRPRPEEKKPGEKAPAKEVAEEEVLPKPEGVLKTMGAISAAEEEITEEAPTENIEGMAILMKDGSIISGKTFNIDARTHADLWERMSPEQRANVADSGGVITTSGKFLSHDEAVKLIADKTAREERKTAWDANELYGRPLITGEPAKEEAPKAYFETTAEAEVAGERATPEQVIEWTKAREEHLEQAKFFTETSQHREAMAATLQAKRLGRAVEIAKTAKTEAPHAEFLGMQERVGGKPPLPQTEEVPSTAFARASAKEFIEARDKSTRPEFLTPYTETELEKAQLFTTADVGYGIMPDGEIVNVFNNSGKKGAGIRAVREAIKNGGTYVTAFDHFLKDYYTNLGFVETERVEWDDKYAPKNWDYEKYGRPDVVTLRLPKAEKKEPAKTPVPAKKEEEGGEELRLENIAIPSEHVGVWVSDFPQGVPKREVSVQVNPRREVARGFLNKSKEGILRAFVDGDGNLYLWDAYDATHGQVKLGYGLKSDQFLRSFLITKSKEVPDEMPEWTGATSTVDQVFEVQSAVRRGRRPPSGGFDIGEELRLEKLVFVSPVTGLEVEIPVQVNPTTSAAEGLLNKSKEGVLRGLIDPDGNLYLWDAWDAIHRTVADLYGVKYRAEDQFLVTRSGKPSVDFPEWRRTTMSLTELLDHWHSKRPTMETRDELLLAPGQAGKDQVTIQDSYGRDIDVTVLVSPSRNRIYGMMQRTLFKAVRVLIDPDGNVYVWDASKATHADIADFYNIKLTQTLRYELNDDIWETEFPRMVREGKELTPRFEELLLGARLQNRDYASRMRAAEVMEKAGRTRKQIWQATGWVRGPGGQWRFEIDDSLARIKDPGKGKAQKIKPEERGWRWQATRPSLQGWESRRAPEENKEFVEALIWRSPVTLNGVLEHSELFRVYPELREYHIVVDPDIDHGGYFQPSTKTIGISEAQFLKAEDVVTTLFHEIQHAIQDIEGFPSGTSVQDEYERLERNPKNAGRKPMDLWQEAYTIYERVAGELEAIDTQARLLYFSKDRKRIPPYELAEEIIGIKMDRWILRDPHRTSFQIDTQRALSRSMLEFVRGVNGLNEVSKLIKEAAEETGIAAFPEVMKRIDIMLQQFIKLDATKVSKRSIEEYATQHGLTRERVEAAIQKGTFTKGSFKLLDPLHSLIRMSLALNKVGTTFKGTLYHETWHNIEKWFFTDEELKQLERFEPDHEKRAEDFSKYIVELNKAERPSWLVEMYDRLIWFFKSLRAKLLGRNFKNLEDVFGWMRHSKLEPTTFMNALKYADAAGQYTHHKALTEFEEIRNKGAKIIPVKIVPSDPETEETAKKGVRVMVNTWMRPVNLSMGAPVPGDTNTPEFKKWFGKSVVTENGKAGGKPLVVYHGTGKEFREFREAHRGETTGHPSSRLGFFFSSVPAIANNYSRWGIYKSLREHNLQGVHGAFEMVQEATGLRPSVIPAYIKVENPIYTSSSEWYKGFDGENVGPYVKKISEAKAAGHDGVILDGGVEVVVFSPTQIKSIFNRGTWSAEEGDISLSLAETGWTPEPTQADVGAEDREIPHIIELPEILDIYKMLMQGKIPGVRKLLFGKEGIRGVFMPGKGIVRLKAAIFKDANLAGRVLAHEIGHVVDWLPDFMIKGNLLGKISSIKNWVKTLPFKPGAPGELTDADRERLREEAIQLLGVTQVLRAKKVDQFITETLKISPEDVLAIWNAVEKAKLFSPELHKYIAGLDIAAKKLIVKAALKGKLTPDVEKFVKIKTTKIGRKEVVEVIEIGPTEKEIAQKLADLLEKEIRVRRLWVEEEVRDELTTLSARWRPWDPTAATKYQKKYRASAEELYADAISVLFNDPQFLKAQAPKFYEAFFNYLENKPDVRRSYLEIQRRIHAGEVDKRRTENFYRMVDEGNDAYGLQYLRDKIPLKDDILRGLVDAFHFIIKDVRKVGEENIPAHLNPRYKLEELVYTPSEIEAMLTELMHNVIKPLEKAGLDWDREFALLTYLMRVAFDPTIKGQAHPGGWDEKMAIEKLSAMRDHELTSAQWEALKKASKAFRKVHETYFIDKAEANEIYDQQMIKEFRNNDTYATWDVMPYLEARYGRAVATRIFTPIGTLQDIANPATATIMKDAAFIKSVNRNVAMRTIVKFYLDYSKILGVDIQEAPKKWNGKFQEIQEPDPASNLGLISYIYKGKAYGYWVPKTVADAVATNPIKQTMTARVLRGLTNPMRQIFTNLNYGFWIVNAFFRDAQRLVMALPGWRVDKFAKAWLGGIKPAFKSVFAIPDDVVQEMQKNNMLISVTDTHDLSNEDKQIERLLRSYQMRGPKVYNKKVLTPWGHLFNYITNRLKITQFYFEATGRAMERTTKIAAYKYLSENFPDMPKEVIGHIVRTRGGSPDFWRAGREHAILNNLLMFINAQKEGYRGDIEAFKENPGEFAAKKFVFMIAPKMLMYAGILGLLGAATKDIFDGISEYDLTNYLIIPIGKSSTGRSVYFRVPTDELSRLVGGVLWKAIRSVPIPTTSGRDESLAVGEGITHLMDYAAGQVPTVSPLISVLMDTMEYACGQNPYDTFYGRHAIGQVEFQAKDERARIQFLQYVLEKLGASIVYKFKHDKIEKISEELEEVLGFPINSPIADFMIKLPDKPVMSNILGRFLKVSNYGEREKLLTAKDVVKTENARTILDAREAAYALVDGRELTDEQVVAIFQKPDVIDRQLMLSLARKYGMVYFEEWLSSSTTAEKMAVLSKMIEKNALRNQDSNVSAPPYAEPTSQLPAPELPPLSLKELLEKNP